ncbi:MAG: transglutaminase domain-containing protein, partial [Ignavibacteriae bacterium]|nr:transglutaminase domain-containing protein [Ignavibacteriota bacterium]
MKKATRSLELSYDVIVRAIPPPANSVIIWIPVPRSDSWQGISDVSVSCAYPFSFHTDPEYGN